MFGKNKEEREQKKYEKKCKDIIDTLNTAWQIYEDDGCIHTGVYLNQDEPAIFHKHNFYLAFLPYVWSGLKYYQQMYCIQLALDNICDEFSLSRRKLKFVLPNENPSRKNIFIDDENFNIDIEYLFVLFESEVNFVIRLLSFKIMDEKNRQDYKRLLRKYNGHLRDYSIKQLTFDELCLAQIVNFGMDDNISVLTPRYKNLLNHEKNIYQMFDRTLFVDPNYTNPFEGDIELLKKCEEEVNNIVSKQFGSEEGLKTQISYLIRYKLSLLLDKNLNDNKFDL